MSKTQPLTVQCPTCQNPVVWSAEQQFKPFCSERCRLIDLGDWATEAHKIVGESCLETDEISADLTDPENW